MRSNVKYYDNLMIADSSRRGYYKEKIIYFCSNLSKLSKDNKDIKILDIACNDGELTLEYKKYGDVIGIDINEKAIRLCKEKKLKCLKLEIGDMLPKHKKYFDVVVAGDIIEHIFDTDKFLGDIKGVLKSGGTLLLTTPNLASLARRFMLFLGINPYIEYSNLLPSKEINVGHIRYYTLSNIKSQLKNCGFEEIEIVGDRINFPFIHIPFPMARILPGLSRNLMVSCRKRRK